MRLVNEPEGTYYRVAVPASLRDILRPLVHEAREDLCRLYEARLPALAALARRYHEFRSMVAYAGAAYRFPEVEAAARTLPPHLSPEDLYFRLDGQVQHLLLDEFQDTSLSQFRFLWPIIEEVRATGRPASSESTARLARSGTPGQGLGAGKSERKSPIQPSCAESHRSSLRAPRQLRVS
jgi:hypothetical protein